jgi:hypothetical protein
MGDPGSPLPANSERDTPKVKLISLQVSWRWSDVIT